MNKEFNLSEKINNAWEGYEGNIDTKEVKEAVRLLKEIISTQEETDLDYSVWIKSQIDKLFGNKLK